jgi:hypothetical protein
MTVAKLRMALAMLASASSKTSPMEQRALPTLEASYARVEIAFPRPILAFRWRATLPLMLTAKSSKALAVVVSATTKPSQQL